MHPEPRFRFLRPILCIIALVSASGLSALPEDAKQPMEAEAPSVTGGLDAGWLTYKGTMEKPAKISQGSLLITGTEIRLFSQNGQWQSAIATGNPARFQQQPAHDQELVKASGKEIRIDNKSHIVTINTAAEIMQSGNLTSGSQIKYNIDTKQVDVEQVHMTFPPSKDKK